MDKEKVRYVDAQAYALLQAIQDRISRDAGWRVVANGRHWLCPYCGDVGVTPYQERRAARDVFKHLVNKCKNWGEGVGTRFGHKLLETKARRIELEEQLRTSKAWQQTDRHGHWYCPYCAEPTSVLLNTDVQGSPVPFEAVERHLSRCAPYKDQHKPLTAEALHLVIRDAQIHSDLTAKVRKKMEEDPNWRKVGNDGKWVCPRCRRRVPEVDVSTDLFMVSVAPGRIARHLAERCSVAQDGASLESEPTAAPADSPAAPNVEPPQPNAERAREIVQKMLPAEVPRVEGYDLHCMYRPTESVGGDFYDYLRLSPWETAILIGDVSGHGLEAALIMAMVKKSLKLHAQQHRSPAEVIRRTNLDITHDLDARTFVTVCYAVLDARSSTLTFARAGHNVPLLFHAQATPPVRQVSSKGMALGLYRGGLFDEVIEEVEIKLRAGEVFVLYTDGLVEAQNSSEEGYGIERLSASIMRTHGDLAAQALTAILVDDVLQFAGNTPQRDDIAVLCLRCL